MGVGSEVSVAKGEGDSRRKGEGGGSCLRTGISGLPSSGGAETKGLAAGDPKGAAVGLGNARSGDGSSTAVESSAR